MGQCAEQGQDHILEDAAAVNVLFCAALEVDAVCLQLLHVTDGGPGAFP
jgi:hypothetical protein